MPRARLLKPGFFTNDVLAEVPYEGRLLFAGLWTIADKAGRLEDRPKRIKGELFPFDNLDIEALLESLNRHGFIHRYTVGSLGLIHVRSFGKHQSPHFREPESTLPACGCESMGEAPALGQPEAEGTLQVGEAPGQPEATTDISGSSPPVQRGVSPAVYGSGSGNGVIGGKPPRSKVVPLSEDERAKLLEEYPGSEESIALALAHEAHKKYPTGQYLYVRNWLRRDRPPDRTGERIDFAKPPGITVPDMGFRE